MLVRILEEVKSEETKDESPSTPQTSILSNQRPRNIPLSNPLSISQKRQKSRTQTSPSKLDRLSQQTINQIFWGYLPIEDWIPMKLASRQWYEYLFNLIKSASLPKHLSLIWNVPFRVVPKKMDDETTVYSLESELFPSIDLPATVNPFKQSEVQEFTNRHLIGMMGWDSTATDSLSSLSNLLVYLKRKKTFERKENFLSPGIKYLLTFLHLNKVPDHFIKQAIQFFNDSNRIRKACRRDHRLAWLIQQSPLANRIPTEELQLSGLQVAPQNRLTRAFNVTLRGIQENWIRNGWDMPMVHEEANKLEIAASISIMMLIAMKRLLKLLHIDEKENLPFVIFMFKYHRIILDGTVGTLAMASFFNISRNYANNVYYDANYNIGDAIARFTAEYPSIRPANFLNGTRHSFFKSPAPQLPLLLTQQNSVEEKETKEMKNISKIKPRSRL